MGSIYNYLYKKRNKKIFNKSSEYRFFREYSYLLDDNPNFMIYNDIENIFDVIKANIIIKSLINKTNLERIIDDELNNKNFKTNEEISKSIIEKSSDLPYIELENGERVFVPIFNRMTNLVYSLDFVSINIEPYVNLRKKYEPFLINPFEAYHVSIFDSSFTKLIKIEENKNSIAFFDYDLYVIFIISKQGYLDNYIVLFDKYLKNTSDDKIIERIKPVVKCYFENNLVGFIFSLYENKLISHHVYKKLCKMKRI